MVPCMRVAEAITLSPDEHAMLDTWANGRSVSLRLVQRARIIQMAADGVLSQDIAHAWNFEAHGAAVAGTFSGPSLAGLEKDAPRPGRIPKIPQRKFGRRGGDPAYPTDSPRTGACGQWPRRRASARPCSESGGTTI